MDVLYFLKRRTGLIRRYYDLSAQPFRETIEKIEAADDTPSLDESGPPHLSEWMEAQDLLDLSGRCCVSLLSASLKLYFMTWARELKLDCKKHMTTFKSHGFVSGYRACFSERLEIDWSNCPADLAIIEQVVLARNSDQHPEHITLQGVTHRSRDLERFPRPFFISDKEAALLYDADGEKAWMSPRLHVSQEKLMAVISNVEALCEWLEPKLFDAKYRDRTYRVLRG